MTGREAAGEPTPESVRRSSRSCVAGEAQQRWGTPAIPRAPPAHAYEASFPFKIALTDDGLFAGECRGVLRLFVVIGIEARQFPAAVALRPERVHAVLENLCGCCRASWRDSECLHDTNADEIARYQDFPDVARISTVLPPLTPSRRPISQHWSEVSSLYVGSRLRGSSEARMLDRQLWSAPRQWQSDLRHWAAAALSVDREGSLKHSLPSGKVAARWGNFSPRHSAACRGATEGPPFPPGSPLSAVSRARHSSLRRRSEA